MNPLHNFHLIIMHFFMAACGSNSDNGKTEDNRKAVVWRNHYWLTDEAVSTYVRLADIFGLEMHSPIMCLGNGIWLFDFDNVVAIARYVPTVLAMVKDRQYAAKGQKFVEKRQKETMAFLGKKLMGYRIWWERQVTRIEFILMSDTEARNICNIRQIFVVRIIA